MESALSIYKEALEMAAVQEKLDALPILYIHFFRLKCMVGSICSSLALGSQLLKFNDVILIFMIKISLSSF